MPRSTMKAVTTDIRIAALNTEASATCAVVRSDHSEQHGGQNSTRSRQLVAWVRYLVFLLSARAFSLAATRSSRWFSWCARAPPAGAVTAPAVPVPL